ncbi:MAG TPA: inorganic phosphate transporter, partial [Azospirillaceae bacterium]|nr:inorganic phosphate transporter [Azospirillaceae bacterium]
MDVLQIGMPALVAIIGVALFFDLINGMHDAANSIATIVSTRVLPPSLAVLWAAFFNFIAFAFFGLHVAATIGKGIVDPAIIDPILILAALIGAIGWNLFTWWIGFPSSSSHALIGGLAGAGIAKGGIGALVSSGFTKAAIGIVAAPLVGFTLALLLMLATSWMLKGASPFRTDRHFRRLQLVSAAAYSLGHGANDAQKTMGIIAVLLFSQGLLGPEFYVPFWVVLAAQTAMGLGTLMGGWRIVKTMGSKLTDLKPYQGFCAETAGAITLYSATALGAPVSTTHTITGSIVGVGSARKTSAVRWGLAGTIVWA